MNSSALPLPQGCEPLCRGCSHRQLDQAASLAQKLGFLRRCLHPWADALEEVRSAIPSRRWGYRTRTTLTAVLGPSGWTLGMWNRDTLVPIPRCPAHTPEVNAALAAVAATMPQLQQPTMAYAVISGAQVVVVLKNKHLPPQWDYAPLINTLQQHGFEALWVHMNPSAGRRLFQKHGWHLLWGEPRSRDHNGLLYGPAAFQQLIAELYNQSLDEAEHFLAPHARSAVADLYCGTGNSIARWLPHGAEVLGVEVGGEAVECARLNVPQATVLRGACRQRVPQLDAWAHQQVQQQRELCLYVNPPRTGLEAEVLEWICQQRLPVRMAYLSCSPGTLSKNLTQLCAHGYAVRRLVPFDFFPQTHHVECLALIERVQSTPFTPSPNSAKS